MSSIQRKLPTFQLSVLQQDVDGLVPCGFWLHQAGAANWSRADVSKWALNAVCCLPALGVSHWGRLLGQHRRVPLEATVTLMHTSCICSHANLPCRPSFIRFIGVSFSIMPVSALDEDPLIKVAKYCTSPKLCWASMNESQRDVNTSRII